MLYQKNYPKVYWDDTSTVTGISFYMLNYARDPIVMHLLPTHYLYFGKNKPFNAIYVEMAHNSNVNTSLIIEYFNGTSYTPVENLLDDTIAFTRSGFIQFDRPTDWQIQTIGGEDQYYLRISVADGISNNTSFQGMNIVFSDDMDLKSIYPGIMNYLDPAERTFILRHENSRNLIIQDIKKFVKNDVDAWDFLHIHEVKQWSSYLTLGNIFSGLQSIENDLFQQKMTEYEQKAEQYKAQFYLSLDLNNNGLEDNAEKNYDFSVRRLVRK